MYADLCRGMDAEQRANLDEELALPLGVTLESQQAAQTAAVRAVMGGMQ